MPGGLVSIVIPAYNPTSVLLDAIASAAAQTHREREIILVNDGSDNAESRTILDQAARSVHTYLEQPNRGPSAARNAGFLAARGDLLLPLDADDLLAPGHIAACFAALDGEHAFVYTDYQVFGARRYDEYPGEYNLHRLLDRNYLSYAALIRKRAWEQAGGYDEAMRLGYEDWEFWLRLGAQGSFGKHVPKNLFRYRRQGVSRSDTAEAHHQEIVEYIRRRHPELYEYESRARIKARWSPAVCVIAERKLTNQTILDIQFAAPGEPVLAAVTLDATKASPEPEAAELAAMGSLGPAHRPAHPNGASARSTLHRHLLNAELLSLQPWLRHPLRSSARLIPLRVKEHINRLAGKSLFDLSFYLQFQPNSLLMHDALVEPLVYYPKLARERIRVALVTPHLGTGGAEAVLSEIASALPPDRFQTLLLATQSRDNRWTGQWRERVEHVYDLRTAIGPERMVAALYSLVSNWRCNYLLVQNSLYGYSAIPQIKQALPDIKVIDVVHSVDEAWDQIAATEAVAGEIDVRVAMAESVRERLLASGTPASRVVLARNGVNLERFQPTPVRVAPVKTVLFAARLDPVKRPVFVADIAHELGTLRPERDFRFVVAGDGPELEGFQQRVHRFGLDALFDFRGQVSDLAPLYAASDLVLLPSRSEGVPLVVLEALASARPVVASKTGSIPEVLDSGCGILIKDLDSAAAYAHAIHTLLAQPALREAMGKAGRRKVEANHDIRQTRETFAALFDQRSSPSVFSTNRATSME